VRASLTGGCAQRIEEVAGAMQELRAGEDEAGALRREIEELGAGHRETLQATADNEARAGQGKGGGGRRPAQRLGLLARGMLSSALRASLRLPRSCLARTRATSLAFAQAATEQLQEEAVAKAREVAAQEAKLAALISEEADLTAQVAAQPVQKEEVMKLQEELCAPAQC